MSGKNIRSVFLISLAGVFVWFIGFLVIMILKPENTPEINKIWIIITFSVTIVLSVVKNMKNDSKNQKER